MARKSEILVTMQRDFRNQAHQSLTKSRKRPAFSPSFAQNTSNRYHNTVPNFKPHQTSTSREMSSDPFEASHLHMQSAHTAGMNDQLLNEIQIVADTRKSDKIIMDFATPPTDQQRKNLFDAISNGLYDYNAKPDRLSLVAALFSIIPGLSMRSLRRLMAMHAAQLLNQQIAKDKRYQLSNKKPVQLALESLSDVVEGIQLQPDGSYDEVVELSPSALGQLTRIANLQSVTITTDKQLGKLNLPSLDPYPLELSDLDMPTLHPPRVKLYYNETAPEQLQLNSTKDLALMKDLFSIYSAKDRYVFIVQCYSGETCGLSPFWATGCRYFLIDYRRRDQPLLIDYRNSGPVPYDSRSLEEAFTLLDPSTKYTVSPNRISGLMNIYAIHQATIARSSTITCTAWPSSFDNVLAEFMRNGDNSYTRLRRRITQSEQPHVFTKPLRLDEMQPLDRRNFETDSWLLLNRPSQVVPLDTENPAKRHKSSLYSQQRMVEDHTYDIAYERIQRLHFIRQLSNERGYGIDTDLPVPLTGHKEMASYVEKLLQSINSTYKRELSIDPVPDSVESMQQQEARIEKIERDLLLRKVMALHFHNPRHPSSVHTMMTDLKTNMHGYFSSDWNSSY